MTIVRKQPTLHRQLKSLRTGGSDGEDGRGARNEHYERTYPAFIHGDSRDKASPPWQSISDAITMCFADAIASAAQNEGFSPPEAPALALLRQRRRKKAQSKINVVEKDSMLRLEVSDGQRRPQQVRLSLPRLTSVSRGRCA
eukprot:6187743-Pleurochrysis_carterae.AAC.1